MAYQLKNKITGETASYTEDMYNRLKGHSDYVAPDEDPEDTQEDDPSMTARHPGKGDPEAEDDPNANPDGDWGDVTFTTEGVQGQAEDAGLTAADFDGVDPSGTSGDYTKADVQKIADKTGSEG